MGERIVLGLGDNIDYEISWDSHVMEQLIVEHGITYAELCTDRPISSMRDLAISILGFLKSESGGERFVDSPQIIEDFTRRFQNKVTLGGTSVRSAIAMRKMGHTSALHLVTINENVRRLIPQDSPWVCSNDKDSSYPHLIIQFGKGTRVRAGDILISTKRANRIIYNHDLDNIAMELNPGFASLLPDARVFLVSGFNAMQSSELLSDRLEKLLRIMRSLPSAARVFYEDACFFEPRLSMQVRRALLEEIDVYSMNEDELQGYLGRTVSLLDAGDVLAALRDAHRRYPAPALVIHTQYWALAFGPHAVRYGAALKAGVTMATTRYRFGDDFTPAEYRETEALPAGRRKTDFVAAISRLAGDGVCCVPVADAPACTETTIGLGDAFVGGFLPALAEE